MHPNPVYRQTPTSRNLAFARSRAFGILTLSGPDGPLASHIPFLLSEDGKTWEAHIVRSNPIWKAIETPQPALVAVSGPDGYISPDWYGIEDQVPTWNYLAVHLRGTLSRSPQDRLPSVIQRLSAEFEGRLAPKPVWTEDKMTPDVLMRMRRMIVPIRMDVASIDGTWKLNQNKADGVRLAAADAVASGGIGTELELLADLMRNPPTAD